MKINLKNLFLFIIGVLLTSRIYSQDSINYINKKNIYISAGIGYKYHTQELDPYTRTSNKVYQDHNSLNFDLNLFLDKGNKHLIGIDIIGFPYTYGDDQVMNPKYFTWIFDVSYRRNIYLYKKVFMYPAAGITIFSNDPVNLLTCHFEGGFGYNFGDYEVFIKNSFRFAPPFFFKNPPWIFITGFAIKI